MIWADKSGTIGWQAVGITPKRPNFSGMVPVRGDGRYEWDGYWPNRLKPSLTNPEKGFWGTANQHVTPDDYPYPEALAFTWADPFRGDRVNEVLAQDNSATIAKSIALQVDVTAIPALQLTPLLLQAPITDPKGKEALAWMKDWDYQLLPESVAAGMYVAWEKALVKEVRLRSASGHSRPDPTPANKNHRLGAASRAAFLRKCHPAAGSLARPNLVYRSGGPFQSLGTQSSTMELWASGLQAHCPAAPPVQMGGYPTAAAGQFGTAASRRLCPYACSKWIW
jgi:acyl-homoserine lactone acylase PvdQ